jgi:hypothetical protein
LPDKSALSKVWLPSLTGRNRAVHGDIVIVEPEGPLSMASSILVRLFGFQFKILELELKMILVLVLFGIGLWALFSHSVSFLGIGFVFGFFLEVRCGLGFFFF